MRTCAIGWLAVAGMTLAVCSAGCGTGPEAPGAAEASGTAGAEAHGTRVEARPGGRSASGTRAPESGDVYIGEVALHTSGGCSRTSVDTSVRGTLRLAFGPGDLVRGFYDSVTEETSTSWSDDVAETVPAPMPTQTRHARRIAFAGTRSERGGFVRLVLGRVPSLDGFETAPADGEGVDWTLDCRRVGTSDPELAVVVPAEVLACQVATSGPAPELLVEGVLAGPVLVLGRAPGVRVRGRVVWNLGAEEPFLLVEPRDG